jgi:redox-sensitive bicupin YhaK (pirin superfamily)
MEVEGTKGRTLFPSPEFPPWPPFGSLLDTFARGIGDSDEHAHRGEEVVNYVLSGVLLNRDEKNQSTELTEGSVNALTAVHERVHDVWPKPGGTAHWLSVTLLCPPGMAEPVPAYRSGPATTLPNRTPGLRWRRAVGEPAVVRSALGLELSDLAFLEAGALGVPVGTERTAVVYVLEGKLRADGRELEAGGGVLVSGHATVALDAEPGTRAILASVPSTE